MLGLSVAASLAVERQQEHHARLSGLRDDLVRRVREAVPEAVLNGPEGAGRLPGNAHFSFPGCEGDSLLLLLDARSSLRFSLGHTSTSADVDALVEALPAVVERARRATLR